MDTEARLSTMERRLTAAERRARGSTCFSAVIGIAWLVGAASPGAVRAQAPAASPLTVRQPFKVLDDDGAVLLEVGSSLHAGGNTFRGLGLADSAGRPAIGLYINGYDRGVKILSPARKWANAPVRLAMNSWGGELELRDRKGRPRAALKIGETDSPRPGDGLLFLLNRDGEIWSAPPAP